MKKILLMVWALVHCASMRTTGQPAKMYDEKIQIMVKFNWMISVSSDGQFVLKALNDSDFLSKVCSKEGVIDYADTKRKLLSGPKRPADMMRPYAAGFVRKWGEDIPKGQEILVEEKLIYELIRRACIKNQWQPIGFNDHLLKLLDRKPILTDMEMQKKALNPTDWKDDEPMADPTKDIRITVADVWRLTISPQGGLRIASLADPDPRASASTWDTVIDYESVMSKIQAVAKIADKELSARTMATLNQSDRFSVDDDLLCEILQAAGKANRWQGKGLDERLLALLDKHPLLKSKERQSEALKPSIDAIQPEDPYSPRY